MEYEKLTYTNELGDSIEFSTSSAFYCNVSKDATGLAGVDSKIYSTNSAQQHGDTYTGHRIEAREITVKGAINIRDKAQAIELRRKALNTEYGNKGALLERNGEEIDCFKDIDVDSTFMSLGIGDNIYRYDAESGVDNLEVSIYYNPQYLGV